MRLTTKGRFAVTAMIDLAMNAQTGAVKLSAISERQSISLSYLEQLFSKLRRAGLVESLRGPGGGYILAAPPAQINIAQIISAASTTYPDPTCRTPTSTPPTARAALLPPPSAPPPLPPTSSACPSRCPSACAPPCTPTAPSSAPSCGSSLCFDA